MAIFVIVVPCGLVEVYHHFRGACLEGKLLSRNGASMCKLFSDDLGV
jgi:hypothetical protein